MRQMLRAALLAATVMVPAMAGAQTAPATPGAPIDNQTTAPDDQTGDVIVTARKISEKLQNAPTTVAVATAATIDNLGLNSVADITKTTPGLVLDNSFGRGGGDRPVIRGQANINAFSGVAYFIDGIYFTGSLSDFDPYNIERLEVVKGPQSALYGRNTYSGAINIITKMPGDAWHGRAQGDISEHDRYDVTAGVSGPLGSGFGLSLNGRYFRDAGQFTNGYDGSRLGKQKTVSGGGMLTYEGGPIHASLRGNYNASDDGTPAIFATSTYENNCFFDNGSVYRGQGRYLCGVIQPRQASSDYTRRFTDPSRAGTHVRTLNTAFRLEADLADRVTLTSLTGYNSRILDTKTDGDYTGTGFQQGIFGSSLNAATGTLLLINQGSATDFTVSTYEQTRDVSEELRLRYDGDRVKLLLGGYYFRQTDHNFDDRVLPSDALAQAQAAATAQFAQFCAHVTGCRVAVGATPISIAVPDRNTNFVTTRNLAVFGSVDFKFTDTLSLSAEGRYASERVNQATQTYNLGQAAPAPFTVQSTFNKFSPRVTLSWQARPTNLLYAIYAEGQKPGGFNGNLAITAGVPTYDAERSRTYEVGSKNTLLGGALIADIALFHTDITGYQLTQAITVINPTTGLVNQTSVTRNAGNARVNGLELSLIARPSRNFTFTANYALANTRFTSGTDQVLGLLYDVADDGLVNCSTGAQFATCTQGGSATPVYGSIVGKKIPRAPEHTVFADADFHQPIGNSDWRAFIGGNVTLTSNSFDQVGNFVRTGGSMVVDGRLGVESGRFKIQGYVRNLTNENSVLQIIRYAGGDLRRNFIAGLRPPRRFGVIVEAKF